MFPLGIIVNVIWATCLGWLNQDRIEEAVWWDNLKNLERSHEEAMKAQEEVFKKELEEFDSRLGIQKKINLREKAMLQHWSVYIQKNELPPETLREFLQGECADDLELWIFNIAFFFWGLVLGLTTAQPVAFNFLNFFLMCLYISSPWSLPENSWLRFGITLPFQLVKARKKGYWNPKRIAEVELNVAVHRLREETDAMLKAQKRIYELEIQLFDSRLKLDKN